ncbi:MAG: hypothetical protein U0794_05945 [Isosphaeraceae bacterium]
MQKAVLLGLEAAGLGAAHSEPIYFHHDQFAASLGLDRPALARAIRAIATELPVDYVSPFRGHATRRRLVTGAGICAVDLGIDFSVLKEHRQHQAGSNGWSATPRRGVADGRISSATSAILGPTESCCGRCDNCGEAGGGTGNGSSVVALDRPAAREVVLKVLSGIARAQGSVRQEHRRSDARGSTSEKLERFGLKLSTFNISLSSHRPS